MASFLGGGEEWVSVDENLRVIDRWLEAYNAHDWERFARCAAESVLYHIPGLPVPLKNRKALGRYYEKGAIGIPDTHLTKVRSFGQDDWVCAELVMTATHKGALMVPGAPTIPATDRSIQVPLTIIARFDAGEIAEAWEYWDRLGMMEEAGISPR